MSKKLSRSDALDDIAAWGTEEVVCLLQKVSKEKIRLRDDVIAVLETVQSSQSCNMVYLSYRVYDTNQDYAFIYRRKFM